LDAAFEKLEQLAGGETLEAPPDLTGSLALGGPSSCVGAGLWVVAQSGEDDRVQGTVELTIPGAVEPVAGNLPG